MIRTVSVGIDVGTYATRVVVVEYLKNDPIPKIIGTGIAESKGLRHGYVVNIHEASNSIKKAITEAEKSSGIKIKRAFLSIGGVSLSSEIGVGSAVISKADGEITSFDIAKAISEMEENLKIPNKKVLESLPMAFKIDGKETFGQAIGMKGAKLEVKTLFVTYLAQHLEDLLSTVGESGIEVIDIVASPLSSARVALTDRQKTAGCVLVDIGSETVSMAVFEDNKVMTMHVFSIGSTDITNDIALGLKIPLEEAEGIKTGSVLGNYPQRKLDQIIEARLSDIFELVDNHLKKIKRSELLPAGAIIVGGGSNIAMIENLAKSMLRLPVTCATGDNLKIVSGKVRDSSWFPALGLCLAGKDETSDSIGGSFGSSIRSAKNLFGSLMKQLLP